MAIPSKRVDRDFEKHLAYDLTTHRLIPTNDLLKMGGVDMDIEAHTNAMSEVERNNIADSVYEYMFFHMPPRNQEIVLALIAENDNGEQNTMARAFIAFAQFALRGGDETSYRSAINLETSMFISSDVMESNGIGWQVKRILKNGNGKSNSGIWKVGKLNYSVSEVTDLVFGVDY